MRKLIRSFKAHPILTPAFLLAAILTILFTIRTVVFTIYWANPAHQDQAIEPWMTVRYVAHSWDLPPNVLAQALGLSPDGRQRLSLQEIAKRDGVSLDELTRRIAAAAKALREAPQ